MNKSSKARARHENFDIRTFVFWNRSLFIGLLQLDACAAISHVRYLNILHSSEAFSQIFNLFFCPSIPPKKVAPFWCRRHGVHHNRTPPHKPIVFIIFLVLSSFCSLSFYINCVFYTKQEPSLF